MSAPDTQPLSVKAMLLAEPRLKRRWMRYRAWKVSKVREEHRAALRTLAQKKRQCVFHFADSTFFCVFLLVMLVVGADACMRRVNSTNGLENLDGKALWPFATILAFSSTVVACVCCARADRHRGRFCPMTAYAQGGGDHGDEVGGVVRWIAVEIMGDNSYRLHLTTLAFYCGVVTGVLFLLRVAGTIGTTYPVLFAPSFVGFGLMCFISFVPAMPNAPALPPSCSSRTQDCCFAWILFLGPLFTFVLLWCLRLAQGDDDGTGAISSFGSGVALSWMHVMIPLLLLDFWLLLGLIGTSIDERNGWALLGYVLIFGPWVAFKVLLAHWLDTGGSEGSNVRLTHVMIPFWIVTAWCFSGLVGLLSSTNYRTANPAILFERAPEREAITL